MPKGQKIKSAKPPDLTRCDFCGQPMKPDRWNSRTCLRCFTEGCPDQSRMTWKRYEKALKIYLRARGRIAQLSGAARQAHQDAILRGESNR